MAKKKTKHKRHPFRNASTPRPRSTSTNAEETRFKRLAWTLGGAGAVAVTGAILRHEGWAPKTIASVLGATGAALALKAEDASTRSVGAGAISAAGTQVALMMIDEHDQKGRAATVAQAAVADSAAPKRQAEKLPPGALESALARAQARLALSEGEHA